MVSLFAPESNYTSRAAELARQKKLADMLIEMSQQEMPVSTAGGITAPVSPYGALAKALTSFGGSYLSGKAAQDEAALKKQDREMAQDALKNLYTQPDTKQLALAKGLASPVETEMAFNMPSYNVATANLKMPSPNGTTDMTLPITMPKMPGEYNQQTTANISLPGVSRAEVETVRGRAKTPEEQMQNIAPLLEGGEISRSLYNALMPDIMKRQAASAETEKQLAGFAPLIASLPEEQRQNIGRLAAVDPAAAVDVFSKILVNQNKPRETKASTLAQLIAERAALSENDPLRKDYDAAIQKETTRAPGVTVQMPRPESSFGAAVGQGLGTQAVAAIEAGKKAPQMIESANRVISILKDPKVTPITGSFADFRLAASKAFYGDNVSAEATENLISDLASSTLDAIPSSGLGTGQGFTQKDKEFLEAAKAGNIGKTKENLIRLAQIRKNIAIASIGKANSTMDVIKNMPGFNNMGQLFTPITYDANSTGLPSSNKSRRRYNPETGNLD